VVMLQYYATVFLGSFLLFIVQPMLTKALLPGFGGSYLVWGASMVFYQGILLAGYIFSHLIQRKMGVARYARWHWILLIAPFLLCPFNFDKLGVNLSDLPLALGVFVILFMAVSLPFFTLSMTSLLLQRWISIKKKDVNPYVLYSASNLGSILALVLYPSVIEPLSSLRQQGVFWWLAYGVLVILHLLCMPRKKQQEIVEDQEEGRIVPVPVMDKVKWLLLSMSACAMLLAVTNVITLDVASIPFLWVLPLMVYLMAFVLTFKHVIWYPRWMSRGLYWVVVIGVAMHLMSQLRLSPPVAVSIVLHLIVLFVVSINCCGLLVKTRPDDSRELTSFYVIIAVGGLLGSLVVSWVVPLISSSLVEYLLALGLAFVSVGVVKLSTGGDLDGIKSGWWAVFAEVVAVVLAVTALPAMLGYWLPAKLMMPLLVLPIALLFRYRAGNAWHTALMLVALMFASPWTEQLSVNAKGVTRLRNYYGIYKIYDLDGIRYLQHGTTQHGRQYIAGPKRNVPLAYFHPTTPAAGVLKSDAFMMKDIGMIGLGTGALAAYAGEGQSFTIYEIDPDNKAIAEEKFSYINYARKKGAAIDYVFGDGRVLLRDRESESLDLFILDAFSSGAIPVHLLTTQAFEEYMRVLRSDGILLLHVSNKMLDLLPVIYSNAKVLGIMACEQSNEGSCDPDAEDTYWAALTRDSSQFNKLTGALGWWMRPTSSLPAPWTDQYSNVLGAMVW